MEGPPLGMAEDVFIWHGLEIQGTGGSASEGPAGRKARSAEQTGWGILLQLWGYKLDIGEDSLTKVPRKEYFFLISVLPPELKVLKTAV